MKERNFYWGNKPVDEIEIKKWFRKKQKAKSAAKRFIQQEADLDDLYELEEMLDAKEEYFRTNDL